MTETNVDRVRRGWEAALRGDLAVIAELLDPEVTWHGGDPTDPMACHNRAQALEFMRRARRRGQIGELVDVVAVGDQVVVIIRPASGSARSASPVANLTTFRDGRVVEMVHYPNPDDALTAAGWS